VAIGIKAIEYALPKQVLGNEGLAALYPGWTADKIYKKTGIASRHVLGEGVCGSDLAQAAAEKLFNKHSISRDTVDFIILVTENPDYILPPTACILQHRLGIPKSAGALDVNLGCSGFVYGLKMAKALVASGEANNVLLLTADGYTRRIHPMDKSTRTIFGDGGAAALITAEDHPYVIGHFDIGTDGSGYHNLIIPAGGLRQPYDASAAIETQDDSGNRRAPQNIFMDGTEIFNFSLDVVPVSVKAALEKNALTMEQIDWFVFHQANKYMLDFLRKTIRIPREKFIVDMEDIGNTVSATIPIALCRCEEKGLFKAGDTILLSGFGVGLSWGSVVVRRSEK